LSELIFSLAPLYWQLIRPC